MTAGPDPNDEAPTPRTPPPWGAVDHFLESGQEEMPSSLIWLEPAPPAENEDEAPPTLRSG